MPTESKPFAFRPTPKPRLIASQTKPAGSVAEIMANILEPGRGRVRLTELYTAYTAECEASGKRPVSANDFAAAIAAICEKIGIAMQDTGKAVFLLKVKIQAKQAAAD